MGPLIAVLALAGAARDRAPSFDRPLARPPMQPPLVLNGGFGEFRIGHFHAGLDLSTGGVTGKPVVAPLDGWFERVRSSGVGYGRSLYLHTGDGRLLVFGHLDAFAGAIAAYVAAAQDSSGQYEQDLWPESGRFRVRAGDVIAWSGESGAGGPHLHFEIRRGDVAYNPLRAGLAVPDDRRPQITSITLEPIDESSWVEGTSLPRTWALGARPETLRASGRLRAIIGARQGEWRGVDRMVPLSVRMEWDVHWIESHFDSVSWATDMSQSDYVYDSERVVGEKGIVMYAPAGFRPRVIATDVPLADEAGVIQVRSNSGPRRLRLSARDVAGHVTTRDVIVLGAAPPMRAVVDSGAALGETYFRAEFTVLPNHRLRVRCLGLPAGLQDVWVGFHALEMNARPAFAHEGAWEGVIAWPSGDVGSFLVLARDARGKTWRGRSQRMELVAGGSWESHSASPVEWNLDPDASFDPPVIGNELKTSPPSLPAELTLVQPLAHLVPENLVLRKTIDLVWREAKRWPQPNIGLYRHDGREWNWIAAEYDSAHLMYAASARRPGWFAVCADTMAPRVTPLAAPRAPVPPPRPYSRWAVEARVVEEGSGVDTRASYFEVDGRRAPTEWDSEQGVLRWRPARMPASGAHRFTAVVADRAGNTRRAAGTFVLD